MADPRGRTKDLMASTGEWELSMIWRGAPDVMVLCSGGPCNHIPSQQ